MARRGATTKKKTGKKKKATKKAVRTRTKRPGRAHPVSTSKKSSASAAKRKTQTKGRKGSPRRAKVHTFADSVAATAFGIPPDGVIRALVAEDIADASGRVTAENVSYGFVLQAAPLLIQGYRLTWLAQRCQARISGINPRGQISVGQVAAANLNVAGLIQIVVTQCHVV